MNENKLIIEQFNKGALNFDSWSVTQNEKEMKSLSEFCELNKKDVLLDVACGTGAFSLFSSSRVNSVTGIDISEGMIEVASENKINKKIENVKFLCQNVEDIEMDNDLFSVVISKSAFHHMKNYKKVFAEMARCCQPGGRICIQDIMAYENDKVNDYFEYMEALIDKSHYKTYSKREFFNLFKDNNIKISGIFESESQLDFHDYVEHVVQSKSNKGKIALFLMQALKNPDIASCFIEKEGRLLWKRKVCTIIGYKR